MSDMEDLKNTIKEYVYNNDYPGSVTRWLIRDWVQGTKGIGCSPEDLEQAISEVEKELQIFFSEGSLKESIRNIARDNKYLFDLIKMPPSRYIN